jgi:Zn finger protein HypA/HybF involved in hydrogenase expression
MNEKECNRCGQGTEPFKHGICPRCKYNNWIVDFENNMLINRFRKN